MRRPITPLRAVKGERVERLSVLLEFQDLVLPDKIKRGDMSLPVRPNVPPPPRCVKCQRYGHMATACKVVAKVEVNVG